MLHGCSSLLALGQACSSRISTIKGSQWERSTVQESYKKHLYPTWALLPLALALDGVSSWLHLGDFPNGCISDPLQCPDGVSLSFKMLVSGYGTGYLFSSAAISVYYNDTTVHFALQVKEKLWEVKSFYRKFMWQTVAMSWSRGKWFKRCHSWGWHSCAT